MERFILTKIDDSTFTYDNLKKIIKIPRGWEQETDDSVKLNPDHKLLAAYEDGTQAWERADPIQLAMGDTVAAVILCIKKKQCSKRKSTKP